MKKVQRSYWQRLGFIGRLSVLTAAIVVMVFPMAMANKPNAAHHQIGAFNGGQLMRPWARVTPMCTPKPACLDAVPPCQMPEPVNGWCPTQMRPSIKPSIVISKPVQPVCDIYCADGFTANRNCECVPFPGQM